jgi:hypothetical protein
MICRMERGGTPGFILTIHKTIQFLFLTFSQQIRKASKAFFKRLFSRNTYTDLWEERFETMVKLIEILQHRNLKSYGTGTVEQLFS